MTGPALILFRSHGGIFMPLRLRRAALAVKFQAAYCGTNVNRLDFSKGKLVNLRPSKALSAWASIIVGVPHPRECPGKGEVRNAPREATAVVLSIGKISRHRPRSPDSNRCSLIAPHATGRHANRNPRAVTLGHHTRLVVAISFTSFATVSVCWTHEFSDVGDAYVRCCLAGHDTDDETHQ